MPLLNKMSVLQLYNVLTIIVTLPSALFFGFSLLQSILISIVLAPVLITIFSIGRILIAYLFMPDFFSKDTVRGFIFNFHMNGLVLGHMFFNSEATEEIRYAQEDPDRYIDEFNTNMGWTKE